MYQNMRVSSVRGDSHPNVQFANLMQNAEIGWYSDSKLAPRLLRGSCLYDVVTDKEVLPLQHLLIQGFPVPGWAPLAITEYFPFANMISIEDPQANQLSECQLRTLTGDGFHWASIGAILSFMWSVASLKDVE